MRGRERARRRAAAAAARLAVLACPPARGRAAARRRPECGERRQLALRRVALAHLRQAPIVTPEPRALFAGVGGPEGRSLDVSLLALQARAPLLLVVLRVFFARVEGREFPEGGVVALAGAPAARFEVEATVPVVARLFLLVRVADGVVAGLGESAVLGHGVGAGASAGVPPHTHPPPPTYCPPLPSPASGPARGTRRPRQADLRPTPAADRNVRPGCRPGRWMQHTRAGLAAPAAPPRVQPSQSTPAAAAAAAHPSRHACGAPPVGRPPGRKLPQALSLSLSPAVLPAHPRPSRSVRHRRPRRPRSARALPPPLFPFPFTSRPRSRPVRACCARVPKRERRSPPLRRV